MGRQNKRSLQLNGARSSKKQRREERASLQAALDAAEGDLSLQLPTNNESSSEDECETIDGQDPDLYYGRLINWFSHKLSLGLIEDYLGDSASTFQRILTAEKSPGAFSGTHLKYL